MTHLCGPEEALGARFQAARQLAEGYKARHDLTDAGLAKRLGEHRPDTLYRLLYPPPGFVPSARRHYAQIRLVRAIERQCSMPDIDLCIEEFDIEEQDDAKRVAWINKLRLQRLLQSQEPGEALRQVGEFCEHAVHAAEKYRFGMSVDVLLAIAYFMSAVEPGQVPVARVRANLRRVDSLEKAAAVPVPEELEVHRPKAEGYAGCARAYAGRLLGNRALIRLGIQAMLHAARTMPQLEEARLWDNVLVVTNRLLMDGNPEAKELAKLVASVACRDMSASLREAGRRQNLSHLKNEWSSSYAGLVSLLNSKDGEE